MRKQAQLGRGWRGSRQLARPSEVPSGHNKAHGLGGAHWGAHWGRMEESHPHLPKLWRERGPHRAPQRSNTEGQAVPMSASVGLAVQLQGVCLGRGRWHTRCSCVLGSNRGQDVGIPRPSLATVEWRPVHQQAAQQRPHRSPSHAGTQNRSRQAAVLGGPERGRGQSGDPSQEALRLPHTRLPRCQATAAAPRSALKLTPAGERSEPVSSWDRAGIWGPRGISTSRKSRQPNF